MPTRLAVLCGSIVLALFGFMAGCGDDETGPSDGCDNCQYWRQITHSQGQFPAVHPTRPELIAYSSRRGNPESENEDIWIIEDLGGGERDSFRITDDPGDERQPAWSTDGTKLSFSRFSQGRYDLWIVNVSDPENPTDLRKISSEVITGQPGRSVWVDNTKIVFSNGDDIYQYDDLLGTTSEIVQDPADQILGLGLRFTEGQPWVVRDPISGSLRLVFTSDGRGPQGRILVTAFAETGEDVAANIFVDQKPLLTPPPNSDTLVTPFEIFGINPADYVVGVNVNVGPDDFCDTTLVKPVRVLANQVALAEFVFERPRGAIRVVGPPTDGSTRVTVFTPAGQPIPTGSILSDTTIIDCLWPGEYFLRLERASIVIDTARVEVCERKLSQVCLSAAATGCPDSLPTIACAESLIYAPPPVGPLPNEKPRAAGSAGAPAKLGSAAQSLADLWVYDFDSGELTRLTDDVPSQEYPTWSPDGRYIAYIQDEIGIRTLRIMSFESRAVRTVPLPGRTSTRVCNRSVAHPSWIPSGNQIVVSLTNCDDEVETNEETDLWIVDVSSFLPQ